MERRSINPFETISLDPKLVIKTRKKYRLNDEMGLGKSIDSPLENTICQSFEEEIQPILKAQTKISPKMK